jgi:hypothetical protein
MKGKREEREKMTESYPPKKAKTRAKTPLMQKNRVSDVDPARDPRCCDYCWFCMLPA